MFSDDASQGYKRVYQLTPLFTEDDIIENIKDEIYQQILAEEYREESQMKEWQLPTDEDIEKRSQFIKAEVQRRFNQQVPQGAIKKRMDYENDKIRIRNREAYTVKYSTRAVVTFAKRVIIERNRYPEGSDPYNCLDDLLLTVCGLNRLGNVVNTLDCESRIKELKEKTNNINWQTAGIKTDSVEHAAGVNSINNLFDRAGNNCRGLFPQADFSMVLLQRDAEKEVRKAIEKDLTNYVENSYKRLRSPSDDVYDHLDKIEEIVEKSDVSYGNSYDISAMLDELKEHAKTLPAECASEFYKMVESWKSHFHESFKRDKVTDILSTISLKNGLKKYAEDNHNYLKFNNRLFKSPGYNSRNHLKIVNKVLSEYESNYENYVDDVLEEIFDYVKHNKVEQSGDFYKMLTDWQKNLPDPAGREKVSKILATIALKKSLEGYVKGNHSYLKFNNRFFKSEGYNSRSHLQIAKDIISACENDPEYSVDNALDKLSTYVQDNNSSIELGGAFYNMIEDLQSSFPDPAGRETLTQIFADMNQSSSKAPSSRSLCEEITDSFIAYSFLV